ncbi:DUF4145 domain-containing protein [Cronobacter sakazakii]|nr:DUF4145 domain-containing protein [Cronobacter sakazakii]
MRIHKLSKAFARNGQVEWPCPACGQLTLQIIEKSISEAETSETREVKDELWFEPDMYSGVFCCMARCSRSQCREVVCCSGISRYASDWDYEKGMEYWQVLKPLNFVPALNPFIINDNCPEEISEPLTASFSVYLAQPGSAANLIRITVERLLTAIGVPERNDKGKRIVLHERLEKHLPNNYSDYAGPLMAIKFLGNAGSHTFDEVKVSDIEDAFEIMEYVVNDIFSKRKESIEVLTKRLNQRFRK